MRRGPPGDRLDPGVLDPYQQQQKKRIASTSMVRRKSVLTSNVIPAGPAQNMESPTNPVVLLTSARLYKR
jgi:hypothetical protein